MLVVPCENLERDDHVIVEAWLVSEAAFWLEPASARRDSQSCMRSCTLLIELQLRQWKPGHPRSAIAVTSAPAAEAVPRAAIGDLGDARRSLVEPRVMLARVRVHFRVGCPWSGSSRVVNDHRHSPVVITRIPQVDRASGT